MKTRHISIGHRIQALVLAAAMIFTSLNISLEGRADEAWPYENMIILDPGMTITQDYDINEVSTVSSVEYKVAVTSDGNPTLVTSVLQDKVEKWKSSSIIEYHGNPDADDPLDYSSKTASVVVDGFSVKNLKRGTCTVKIENPSSYRAIIYYNNSVTSNYVYYNGVGYGSGSCLTLNASPVSYTSYTFGDSGSSWKFTYPGMTDVTDSKAIAVDMTERSLSDIVTLSVTPKETDGIVSFSDDKGVVKSYSNNTAQIVIPDDGLYTIHASSDDNGSADFYIYAFRAINSEEYYSDVKYNSGAKTLSNLGLKCGDNSYTGANVTVSPVDSSDTSYDAKIYRYNIALTDPSTLNGLKGFSTVGLYEVKKSPLSQTNTTITSVSLVNDIVTPVLAVKDDKNRDVDPTGYSIDSIVEEPGDTDGNIKYTITISGRGNYEGTITESTELAMGATNKLDLSSLVARITDESLVYDGNNPAVTIEFRKKDGTLLSSQPTTADYTLSFGYSNSPLEVGNVVVTISAKPDSTKYRGSVTAQTSVDSWNISDAILSGKVTVDLGVTGSTVDPSTRMISAQRHTGQQVKFENIVLRNTVAAKELTSSDYELEYDNNVDVTSGRKASVTIKGKGNYTGSITFDYDIIGTFENSARLRYYVDGQYYYADAATGFKLDRFNPIYTGRAIEPEYLSLYIGQDLISKSYYTVTTSNNTNAGTATVSVKLINDDTKNKYYASTVDQKEFTFDIAKKDIADTRINLNASAVKKYSGSDQVLGTSDLSIIDGGRTLISAADYNITPQTGKNAGRYYADITGLGNYKGTTRVYWEIEKLVLPDGNFVVSNIGDVSYTGNSQNIGNLMEGKVTLNGNAIETFNYTYTLYDSTGINALPIDAAKEIGTYYVEVSASPTGSLVGKASTKSKLNIVPKAASLKVRYNGQWLDYKTGSSRDFVIPESLNTWSYTGNRIVLSTADFAVFDGDTRLNPGTEWDLITDYQYATEVGEAYTSIRLKGNYNDDTSNRPRIYFTITPRSVENVIVTKLDDVWSSDAAGNYYPNLKIEYQYVNNVGQKKKAVLVKDVDYTLEPADGTNLTIPEEGKYIVIKGIGTYSGEKTCGPYTLGKSLFSTDITVGIDGMTPKAEDRVPVEGAKGGVYSYYEYTYTGSVPTIYVKDAGTDIASSKYVITYYDSNHNVITDETRLKNNTNLNLIYVDITPASGQVDYYLRDNQRVGFAYRVNPKPYDAAEFTFDAKFANETTDAVYSKAGQTINFSLKNGETIIPASVYTVGFYKGDELLVRSNGRDSYFTIPVEKANVGAYTVRISSTNTGSNYTGFEEIPGIPLTISQKSITDPSVVYNPSDIPNQEYTGKTIIPEIELKDGTYTLKKDEDYKVEKGPNNIDIKDKEEAAPPKITITGIGNYSGTVDKIFSIVHRAIDESFTVTIPQNTVFLYDGEEKTIPENALTVKNKEGVTLKKGIDYKVEYASNTLPGDSAEVKIIGMGSYNGEISKNFTIMIDLSSAVLIKEYDTSTKKYRLPGETGDSDWKDMDEKAVYVGPLSDTPVNFNENGATVKQFNLYYKTDSSTVKIQEINKSEYSEEFKKITYPGNHVILLKGNKSEFVTGEKELTVKAIGDLSRATVEVSPAYVIWNGHDDGMGGRVEPNIIVKYNGHIIDKALYTTNLADYQSSTQDVFSFALDIRPQADSQYLTGSNNTASFKVVYDISKAEITGINSAGYRYTGDEIKPAGLKLKITANGITKDNISTDYFDWQFSNNVNVTDNAVVTAKAKDINDSTVFAVGTVVDTFKIEGVAFDTTNITVKIIGDKEYPIADADASKLYHTPYNGLRQFPEVKVMDGTKVLEENKDYTLVWPQNNKDAGNATILITGKGGYKKDTITANFVIDKLNLSNAKIKYEDEPYKYEGGTDENKIQPKFYIYHEVAGSELVVPASEYEKVYSSDTDHDPVNSGISVTAKTESTNYMGTNAYTYVIQKTDVNDSMISIESSSMEYTGKKMSPIMTLTLTPVHGMLKYTLEKGVDYTISPAEIGPDKKEYEVVITGIGGFEGTRTEKITIINRKISNPNILKTYEPDREYKQGNAVELTDLAIVDTDIKNASGENSILVEGKDYKVEYRNNSKAGKAASDVPTETEPASGPYAIVTGLGNYEGSVVYLPFNIGDELSAANDSELILNPSEVPYNGRNHSYDIMGNHVVKFKGNPVTNDFQVNYVISYYDSLGNEVDEITNAGTYTIKAVPQGEYYGSLEATYVVKPVNVRVGNVSIELPREMYNSDEGRYEASYTGSPIKPEVHVFYTFDDLYGEEIDSKEYKVIYTNNESVSEGDTWATVEIEFYPTGNYYHDSGQQYQKEFCILERPLFENPSEFEIQVGQGKIYFTEDGSGLTNWENNELKVIDKEKGTVLVKDRDYSIAYQYSGEDNTTPVIGSMIVTITGKGNYRGSVTLQDKVAMYAKIENATNTEIMVSTSGRTVEFSGETVSISRELKSTQYGDPASDAIVIPSIPSLVLGGKTVYENVDYVYAGQIHRANVPGARYGYGYAVIQPISEYIDGKCLVVGYNIAKSLNVLKLTLTDADGNDFDLNRIWTGSDQKPNYVIKEPNGRILVKDGVIVDSTEISSVGELLFTKNNVPITSEIGRDPGTYKAAITVKDKNGSSEQLSATYVVNGIDLSTADVSVAGGNIYKGAQLKPTVLVKIGGKIISDKYYDVYQDLLPTDNIGPNGNLAGGGTDHSKQGKATVTAKGSGITGSKTVYFDIKIEKPTNANVLPDTVTSTGARVSWQKAWGGLEGDSVGYDIVVFDESGAIKANYSKNTNDNMATIAGLTPFTNYTVKVYTKMKVNGVLYYSDPVEFKFATKLKDTAAANPVNPGVSSPSGTGAAKVTWEDNGNYISFRIYRGNSNSTNIADYKLIASVPASKKEYQDNSLATGSTYYYRIVGVSLEGGKLVEDRGNMSAPVKVTVQ